MATYTFELKTSSGVVIWEGISGENAAQRYADSHPGVTVYAWRYPKVELKIGMIKIEG
jgi:hypothetical protein